MPSRLWTQVRALIVKDFIVIRAHKRAMIVELVFPLLMATMSCLMLTLFVRMAGQNPQPLWSSPGQCSTWWAGVTPANLTYDPFAGQSTYEYHSSCIRTPGWQYPTHYDNWTSLMAGFSDYFVTLTPNQQGYAAFVALEMKEADNQLIVHHRNEGWQSPPVLGALAYSVFKNTSVAINARLSSNVVSFNIKVMFATSAALMMNFAFLPMASTMAGRLVDEKNARVREHLRVMGVSPIGYLLSALVTASARVMFVSVAVFILLLSMSAVPVANAVAIFFTTMCFGFSLAGFAQILPAFFSKSTFSNAAVSIFLAVFTSGAPFATMLPPQAIIALCVFFSPTTAVIINAQLFGGTDMIELPLPIGLGIFFLLMQVIFYSLLSQYLYAINPGDYGVPRSPLFPIHDLVAFCRGGSGSSRTGGTSPRARAMSEKPDPLASQAHTSPSSPQNRIIIEGLFKYYGGQRDTAAVHDLSLTIREGEIFCLLGHNGAGKTTTISMLTGMVPATAYHTATVMGFDLDTEMDAIRQHIGSCPQFDVLFDDLSAQQHVDLYAALKGKRVGEHRGLELLHRLKLPLTDQRASTFSGGMKRRLSLANALVGDSTVIYADEPSSGLDPVSRREMWELLKAERASGKTIILTTHYLEEADYLGDRIAIMSHGRKYCCDTSANLKHAYGVGYYLKLVKTSVESTTSHGAREKGGADGGVHFNREGFELLFARHGIAAKLHHESVGDCTFLLPHDALVKFGSMLEELESQMVGLGVSSYGVAMNSLEDVFVAISEREAARVASEKDGGKSSPGSSGNTHTISIDTVDPGTTRLQSGALATDVFTRATFEASTLGRFFSQVLTIMYKKALFFRRSKRLLFMGLIVPLIMVAIGYASLIPVWNQGGNVPYGSWLSQSLPDMDNVDVAVWYHSKLTGSEEPTPDARAAMEKWTQYYAAMRKLQGFNSKLTYQFVPGTTFNSGAFLRVKTISWINRIRPAVQLRLEDTLLFNDSIARYPEITGGFPAVNFTWIFQDQYYSDSFLMMLDPTLRAAFDAVAEGVDGPVPNVIATPLVVDKKDFNTPSPTESQAPMPTPAPYFAPGEEYFLTILAIMMVLVNGQYCSNVALFIADDLNRHIYHTLRIHGCSAAAYWVGNLLFDLSSSLVLVVAYIIGAYARGVHQIQNMQLVFHCFMIVTVMLNTLLIAYATVCILPENLKPNTYIGVINAVVVLMMVVPLVAYLAANNPPTILVYLTPPRALFYAIATYHDPSKVWSDKNSVGAIISTLLWNVPAVVALWCYSYLDSERVFGHTEGAANLPASGAASAYTTNVNLGVASESASLLANSSHSSPVGGVVVEDPDVLQEAERVRRAPDDYMIAAIDLRKVYRATATDDTADGSALARACAPKVDKLAVRGLTLGIKAGESLGLLGPNGCGKSTTIRMLLREIAETAGRVVFPHDPLFAVRSKDDGYRYARLGVCQQGDTLWDLLTAEEHMRIYLRMRLGSAYNSADWEPYIESALRNVLLDDAGTKGVAAYSGGMKRKLALCIAMYSGAVCTALDEPSSGVDAFARRGLWRSINEALKNEHCVLLTTHALEESEAVCARIAIMTNGQLRCIGNGQHLKNRFGSGYTIILTLRGKSESEAGALATGDTATKTTTDVTADEVSPERISEIRQLMAKTFGSTCELKETLGRRLRFSVNALSSLAFAFRALQSNSEEWGVEQYSVSQVSSLEQIFINFAGAAASLDGN